MDNYIITVRSCESEDFRLTTDTDHLPELPLVKSKKLFRMICSAPELNADALAVLPQWLEDYVQTTKEKWRLESINYQLCYIAPQFIAAASSKERQRIKAQNAKLLRAVKKAKAAHERAVKMQSNFNEFYRKEE